MVPRGDGIIVNISSPGGLTYLFNTAYGVGKAAQDRMSQDFNMELKGTGVKVKLYIFDISLTELKSNRRVNS